MDVYVKLQMFCIKIYWSVVNEDFKGDITSVCRS